MKPMDPSWLFEEIQRRWGSVSRHHDGYPKSYPCDLEGKMTLHDGTRVPVRPIRPDDIEALKEGFAQLSAESVYRRFHAHLGALSDEACRYLTHVDYVDHLALVALAPDQSRGIGVARYYRPEESNLAEAAVAVVDDWQRRGVGSALLDLLIEAAIPRGIEGFEAYVQPDNDKVLSLLDNSVYGSTREELDGVVRIEVLFDGSSGEETPPPGGETPAQQPVKP